MNDLLQNESMWKLATPVISYIGTAILKAIYAKLGGGGSIPAWLKPIIAGLLGTATGLLTGDPSMAAANAAEGFALGGGAPMVYEIKERLLPKQETKTADLGNA
jgi:hypothetical protein